MKLNGALQPHHGATCSNGVNRNDEQKQCVRSCNVNWNIFKYVKNNNNNKNNNNYNNNNNNNNNKNNNDNIDNNKDKKESNKSKSTKNISVLVEQFKDNNVKKNMNKQKKELTQLECYTQQNLKSENDVLAKKILLCVNKKFNNNNNNNKNQLKNLYEEENKSFKMPPSSTVTRIIGTVVKNVNAVILIFYLNLYCCVMKKSMKLAENVIATLKMRVKQSLRNMNNCVSHIIFMRLRPAHQQQQQQKQHKQQQQHEQKQRHRLLSTTPIYELFNFENSPKNYMLLFALLFGIILLPTCVNCDDSDNFFAVNSFSAGPETTTPQFDYASRGKKKFGDKCDNTLECGFPGSICDPKKKSCQCTEDLPVTNHIDKCGKEAAVNESCFFNEQCEVKYFQTECRDGRCICRFEMTPIFGKDGSVECKGRQDKRGPETYIDPAMIGVLVGMALMFIIICVVLRLFSQARWRENRTIFNTPNPRLMNVSLLRDSKLLHGQERRGSRISVRAPSMGSLRPHSPNPSLGKTGSRSGSHGSNASATSIRSTRSNSVAPGNTGNSHHERQGSGKHTHHHQQQQQHHQQHHQQHQQHHQPMVTNITPNPVAESVTVEIIEPKK